MYEFGFIGTGNMGSAIARAVSAKTKNTVLSDRECAKAQSLANELGCMCADVEEAASAKYVVLGVKPNMLAELFEKIKGILAARKDRFILVSMAAGTSIDRIKELAGADFPIIRIMPNLPVQVGYGMTVYATSGVSDEEAKSFENAMEASGTIIPIEERLIDAASAISGSGPAFAAMFTEAMADAAVKCGLTRSLALKLAAETVVGTGIMIKNGVHPAILKDNVSSPGGTTIEGVKTLEEHAFRGAVMDACEATYIKNKKM